MRPNAVTEAIRNGRTVVNAWMSTGSGYVAEVLSHSGVDAVTVDAQHGMFGRDAVVGLLQAVSCGPAVPLVRPSSLDAAEIGWLLDAGAYGVIAPGVDSAAMAAGLVAACRYPPQGRRSYGPARGLLHGGPDYLAASADTLSVWAMVESREALEDLEAIAATPGLDGLYLGPNDLALALGLTPGGRIGPEVEEVALRLVEVCQTRGIAAGLFCADGAEAARFAAAGFDLVTPGNDASYLRSAAADRIATIRGPAPDAGRPGGY